MTKSLEFGTGGLRGIIGEGPDKINVGTIRKVSRAFAGYMLEKNENPSVVIAYDNRKYSNIFATESALIFSQYNIKVWLFEEITPTPILSFAVRELGASGGVVITASHNPKEYNGYKIYDENGCQCLPAEAKKVADLIEDSQADDITNDDRQISRNSLISYVPEYVTGKYYDEVMKTKAFSNMIRDVSVVYTPLNGTGRVPVETILKRGGIGHFYTVRSQEWPDPEFTTCPRPNPEEDDALAEGIKLCRELVEKGEAPDILLATDPDCDRIGVMVNIGDEFRRLDGNQVGVLLFDYIQTVLRERGIMPEDPLMITTIVSTAMTRKISLENGIHEDRVLTGFKYIGDKIEGYSKNGESDRFIFGFEESCGYLAEPFVRDKDAVSAALLVADMTGYYKSKGITLADKMNELYEKYGYFLSSQRSIERLDNSGKEEISSIMECLRTSEFLNSMEELAGFIDYAIGIGGLEPENVLEFKFKDKTKVIIRPSGTEPKIKLYFFSEADRLNDAERIMNDKKEDFMKRIFDLPY